MTTRLAPLTLSLLLIAGNVHAAPNAESPGFFARLSAKAGAFVDKAKALPGKLIAAHAARKEQKAATKDWKSFLGEKGNEDIKTFHAGARKEESIGAMKFGRAIARVATAVNVGTMVLLPTPLGAAGAGLGMSSSHSFTKSIRAGEKTAATRTTVMAVNRPGVTVDSARLARWAKAGVIDSNAFAPAESKPTFAPTKEAAPIKEAVAPAPIKEAVAPAPIKEAVAPAPIKTTVAPAPMKEEAKAVLALPAPAKAEMKLLPAPAKAEPAVEKAPTARKAKPRAKRPLRQA